MYWRWEATVTTVTLIAATARTIAFSNVPGHQQGAHAEEQGSPATAERALEKVRGQDQQGEHYVDHLDLPPPLPGERQEKDRRIGKQDRLADVSTLREPAALGTTVCLEEASYVLQ
jgi:hypothetical protein